MKRIFLTIAGLAVLVFLAVPLFAFGFRWTAGTFDNGIKKQAIDDFIWGQPKSSGNTLALSRSNEAFNFFDIGDLALSSQPLVQDALNKLSHFSGVKIDRGPGKNSSIAIFHDTNVFTRLKDDRQAFRAVGLSEPIIDELTQRAPEDARCVTLTRTDDEMNIVLTVVLSSQQADFHGCLVSGLLNSFGIKSNETINASKLVSTCVLYEARRLGLRDRQHISEQASALRDKCLERMESQG